LTFRAVSSNAIDKGALLKEHVSNRMELQRPLYVTSQIAFFDTSLLSAVPDSAGLVSIALHGYVHTQSGTRVVTMQKWIVDAVWTPVPSGLASDREFKTICRGSQMQTILGPRSLHMEASG
jgi:hypothetical protein